MVAVLIPPTPTGSNHNAARAFARVGWPKVWATLHLYARGTLRLAAIGARRAHAIEAADLVNTLVKMSLDGTLGWTLPEHATDEEILRLACMKLHGMRWTLRRQAARTVYHDDHHDGALDERPDPGPDALARLMAKRGFADLERLFEHDAEGSAYFAEMLEGKTCLAIAGELGCTLEQGDTVRRRVVRRVAALCRRMNDDSE
jgi:hypothetical protein